MLSNLLLAASLLFQQDITMTNYGSRERASDSADNFIVAAQEFPEEVKVLEVQFSDECMGDLTAYNAKIICNVKEKEKTLEKISLKSIHNQYGDLDCSMPKAAYKGNMERVKTLLDQGEEVNQKEQKGYTSLHLASLRGKTKIVELLLDRGADINLEAEDGKTALHLASLLGKTSTANVLIEHSANLEAREIAGATPLLEAAFGGHEKMIDLLLSKGAILEAKSDKARTALHTAALAGRLDAIKILLKWSADKEALDYLNLTPVMTASDFGNVEIAIYLLENGASLGFGKKLLFDPAIINGQTELVQYLIKNAYNLESVNEFSFTPFNLATCLKKFDIAEMLLKAKVSVTTPDKNQTTPLHYAVFGGCTSSFVSEILQRGADINAKEQFLNTPLQVAAKAGYYELVSVLLENGAETSHQNVKGMTALNYAKEEGHTKIVKLITEHIEKQHFKMHSS
ncbi:MAG: ankyrin repeat protein [Chlamydiales bacterium]|jgi:ankyrin repeat protein